MEKYNRAVRRHHRERLKKNRINYNGGLEWRRDPVGTLSSWVNTPCPAPAMLAATQENGLMKRPCRNVDLNAKDWFMKKFMKRLIKYYKYNKAWEEFDIWDSDKPQQEQKFIGHPIKITVKSKRDKDQLLLAFKYLHDNPIINTDYMAVNYLVHIYTDPDIIEIEEE